jgi:hypothetical protein
VLELIMSDAIRRAKSLPDMYWQGVKVIYAFGGRLLFRFQSMSISQFGSHQSLV